MVLGSEPTAAVTVTIASDNTDVTVDTDAGASGNQNTLSFTTTTWNTPQTVTVSAGEDQDNLRDTATLSHTAGGGDYGSITADVDVTVTDNDLQTVPTANAGDDQTVNEGGFVQLDRHRQQRHRRRRRSPTPGGKPPGPR